MKTNNVIYLFSENKKSVEVPVCVQQIVKESCAEHRQNNSVDTFTGQINKAIIPDGFRLVGGCQLSRVYVSDEEMVTLTFIDNEVAVRIHQEKESFEQEVSAVRRYALQQGIA